MGFSLSFKISYDLLAWGHSDLVVGTFFRSLAVGLPPLLPGVDDAPDAQGSHVADGAVLPGERVQGLGGLESHAATLVNGPENIKNVNGLKLERRKL